MKAKLLLVAIIVSISYCIAQDSTYTFPFTLDKKLIVFKGKLNGIETDFAFDTGADLCIADSNHKRNNAVENLDKSPIKLVDGNGQRGTSQLVKTSQLTLGGFTMQNVTAIYLNNIPFLNCFHLYLLGSNVIKHFHWQIDFENRTISISNNPFPVNESMSVIPVDYNINCPVAKLSINGKKYKNFLIDLGYDGSLEMSASDKSAQKLLESKREIKEVKQTVSYTYAALGASLSTKQESIFIDNVEINNTNYQKIKAVFTNADSKIGLGFFKSNCSKLIINNEEGKYYLQRKMNIDTTFSESDFSVLLKDNQLKVVGFRLYDDESLNKLQVNEIIKSINDKTAQDFKDECDYLKWILFEKRNKLVIEKTNGEKVIISNK